MRISRLTFAGVAVAIGIGIGGLAGAAALRPAPAAPTQAPDRPVLQVRYEVRREVAYVPPPPTEATRLEVLSAQGPTVVEEGVLSAQAGQALRMLDAEDAARTAAALASVRAADARVDRETASSLQDGREGEAADDTAADRS